jgi:hypothetical protein
MTTAQAHYEPCEECGALLDPQQRYCVNCAARRANGANPSSRYFATMSQRARRPAARPPAKGSSASRAAAVGFFALLPVAVALGVLVGRSDGGDGESQALLEALRRQESAVASSPATGATGASAKKAKGRKASKSGKGGKVVAHTSNGALHQVTGYKPSKKVEAEDTHLVEANPEQTGENYIKAQQNLPDVIVVGSGSSTPAPATGKGQP